MSPVITTKVVAGVFCAKDVCDALGYSKARNAIAQHVDDDDALILSSKLDSVKRFKHWVTSEVLPL